MKSKKQICAELYFILTQVPFSFASSIPQKFIDNLKNDMSVEWYNKFNPEIPFTKQKFDKKTLKVLDSLKNLCWLNAN